MDIATGLIGIAWLAIALMLVWGAAVSIFRLLGSPEPLPFFVMLERRGLTAVQVEAAAGTGGVARALRRCALCAWRRDCRPGRIDCPNEALIAHVTRLAQA